MITFYKICCLDENITDCYIGSTKDLNKRKISHKNVCENTNNPHHNYKVYKFIRENKGFNNWTFKILNEVEYYDKNLRYKMEQAYIDCYKPSLNTFNATGKTYEEYHKDNRDRIIKYKKNYRLENREKVLEQDREFYKNNREQCIKNAKNYQQKNSEKIKQRKKEYREKNKEKISEYNKEYTEKNKEKRKEYDRIRNEKKKESKNNDLV